MTSAVSHFNPLCRFLCRRLTVVLALDALGALDRNAAVIAISSVFIGAG
jgi:hypothetical protein